MAAIAHDMTREYNIQKKLKVVYPMVPSTVAQCQAPSVLGCAFYVMEQIARIIPRANL
ncbi:hypothetical protein D3C81_1830660 [compost metagenome]